MIIESPIETAMEAEGDLNVQYDEPVEEDLNVQYDEPVGEDVVVQHDEPAEGDIQIGVSHCKHSTSID